MPYVLSDNEYEDFRAMRRLWRVGGGGVPAGPNGDTTRKFRDAPLWAKIVDYEVETVGIWNYSLDLYPYLDAPTAIPGGAGVGGRNSFECDSTSAFRSGYDIVTSGAVCGDIIGTANIPVGLWVQIVDYQVIAGNLLYVFSVRNDPTFQE